MAKKTKNPPESIPGGLIPWPPAGGTEYKASASDDWWKVAKAANRTNVWDTIVFNFGTSKGGEVNYYMRTKLGCYATKKGNWKFGREDGSPSVLYLPPTNWKLAAGAAPAPPNRPPMGGWDKAMAVAAVGALRCIGIYSINFTMVGQHISCIDFLKIADRIANGSIAVYAVPADDETAKYNPRDQAFYIRTSVNTNDLSLVVHEAVHAIMDLRGAYNITTADDEAAAYFAQTCWVQRTKESSVFQLDTPGHNAVLRTAFTIWQKSHTGYGLTAADFQPLRQAIVEDSYYKNDANQVAEYDGMYEFAPV